MEAVEQRAPQPHADAQASFKHTEQEGHVCETANHPHRSVT